MLCKPRPLRFFNHTRWPPSSAVAPRLDALLPIEEEKTPYYDPSLFYPARLGQVLNERYQIATKVGYGSSSTVWLARDLRRWRWTRERYVAVKISAVTRKSFRDEAENELAIMKHISRQNTRHQGWNFVRKLLDSFTIDGASGRHLCLIFEPLREPLWLYCRRYQGDVIPPDILKVIVQMILHGLDYLHSECHVIHTDLKPDNVLVKIEDSTILESDARDEYCHPLPQKVTDERTIYLSRNNYGQFQRPAGLIQICDFGLSVSGKTQHTGCIQAEAYRAPEVILDAGYTYSADIWSLGVMVRFRIDRRQIFGSMLKSIFLKLWDLLEGQKLFHPVDLHNGDEYSDLAHLAQLTALLGPPPEGLLSSGKRTSKFYESQGSLRSQYPVPEDFRFENTITKISDEEKSRFLDFAKRMIRWCPKERSTAKELLGDPWLYEDVSGDSQ